MTEIPRPPQAAYTLRSGFRHYYEPSILPPDGVSELMGSEGASVVNALRFVAREPSKPIHVLDLGVGSGIHLVKTTDASREKRNLHLYGIDKSPSAVQTTQENLERLVKPYPRKPFIDIQQQDWFEPSTWESLGERKYHIIFFNPPFHPRGEHIRKGYESVDADAIYTQDPQGIEHYERVLHHLPSLLHEDIGSTILIRQPVADTEHAERYKVLKQLINAVNRDLNSSIQYTEIFFRPVAVDRIATWSSISRTNGDIPLHKDPLVLEGQRLGLDHVPTIEEILQNQFTD